MRVNTVYNFQVGYGLFYCATKGTVNFTSIDSIFQFDFSNCIFSGQRCLNAFSLQTAVIKGCYRLLFFLLFKTNMFEGNRRQHHICDRKRWGWNYLPNFDKQSITCHLKNHNTNLFIIHNCSLKTFLYATECFCCNTLSLITFTFTAYKVSYAFPVGLTGLFYTGQYLAQA